MGTKSRGRLYSISLHRGRAAVEARRGADKLACDAWTKRMLAFKGPAQPSPALGDALNAGYPYLEVRRLGCDTHQAVALDIVRRPKTTPIYELERYIRCKDCSQVRRVSIRAELSGGAQADQDYGKRSAVVLVAGGAMKSPFRTTIRGSHSQDEISATTASDKVGNQPALR